MLRNYLKITLRNLMRHKLYSLINILGLAIGMACAFLILGFVRFELNYDRYHPDADRIYRIIRQVRNKPGGHIEERFNTGAPLLPFIKAGLPGIERAARLGQSGGVVSAGDRRFVESRFFFADADLGKVQE